MTDDLFRYSKALIDRSRSSSRVHVVSDLRAAVEGTPLQRARYLIAIAEDEARRLGNTRRADAFVTALRIIDDTDAADDERRRLLAVLVDEPPCSNRRHREARAALDEVRP